MSWPCFVLFFMTIGGYQVNDSQNMLRALLPMLEPDVDKIPPIPKQVMTDMRALIEMSTAISCKKMVGLLAQLVNGDI